MPKIFRVALSLALYYVGGATRWIKLKFVKIEATVLVSKVNIPDFFQLIMKICIKIDFLRP